MEHKGLEATVANSTPPSMACAGGSMGPHWVQLWAQFGSIVRRHGLLKSSNRSSKPFRDEPMANGGPRGRVAAWSVRVSRSTDDPPFFVLNGRKTLFQQGSTQTTSKDTTIYRLRDHTPASNYCARRRSDASHCRLQRARRPQTGTANLQTTPQRGLNVLFRHEPRRSVALTPAARTPQLRTKAL